MKMTSQPKKLRRLKKHGFLHRMRTPGGRRVLKKRMTKGRKILTVSDEFRILKKKPKSRNR